MKNILCRGLMVLALTLGISSASKADVGCDSTFYKSLNAACFSTGPYSCTSVRTSNYDPNGYFLSSTQSYDTGLGVTFVIEHRGDTGQLYCATTKSYRKYK